LFCVLCTLNCNEWDKFYFLSLIGSIVLLECNYRVCTVDFTGTLIIEESCLSNFYYLTELLPFVFMFWNWIPVNVGEYNAQCNIIVVPLVCNCFWVEFEYIFTSFKIRVNEVSKLKSNYKKFCKTTTQNFLNRIFVRADKNVAGTD